MDTGEKQYEHDCSAEILESQVKLLEQLIEHGCIRVNAVKMHELAQKEAKEDESNKFEFLAETFILLEILHPNSGLKETTVPSLINEYLEAKTGIADLFEKMPDAIKSEVAKIDKWADTYLTDNLLNNLEDDDDK